MVVTTCVPSAHALQGCGTWFVCVCVCLSVITLAATSFIFKQKIRYHRLLYGVSWILTHGFCQKGFVQEIQPFLLVSTVYPKTPVCLEIGNDIHTVACGSLA